MQKLWIIFLLCYLPLSSQPDSVPLRFQKIKIEQGLPHNFVRAITQDKKGFIWIGTNYGLARYDGYDFKVFQPDQLKPNSIAQKSIDMIFADSKGNLWLSFSTGGIGRMDLKTEHFSNYYFDATNKYPLGSDYSLFLEDSDSDIWAATTHGVFLYNKSQDKFIYTFTNNIFKTGSNKIISFTDDKLGNIWFVGSNKVFVLHKKTMKIVSLGEFSSIAKLDEIEFNKIYSKEKGKIWLGTQKHGLLFFDIPSRKIEYFLSNVTNIESIFMDRNDNLYIISNNPHYQLFACKKQNIDKKLFESFPFFNSKTPGLWANLIDDNFGNIYISTQVGLATFNFNSGLKQIQSNPFINNSISDDYIENIFIDRTDNLWISPHRKGLNKADLRQKPFRIYSPTIKSFNNIPKANNVSSVYVDRNGRILSGEADNLLNLYDKKTNNSYQYLVNSLTPNTAIFEDSEGYIWLGWNVLYKVKIPDLKKSIPNANLPLPSVAEYNVAGVKKICSDKKNNLWLAAIDGLVELNLIKNEAINHSMLFDSLNKINGFYRTVFIDKNQTIWGGTNSGGLIKYEKSKKKFRHFMNNPQSTESICSNTIYAIYEDNEGYLWIGTRQGLEKFNPKTEKFEHAGIGNELSKRSIFSVFPDTMGNFWMSSDIGIIRYNIKSKQSSFFGKADGLDNNEFSTTASYLSKSGEIFLGGMEGLISFFPSNIKPNPIHAKPVITNFRVANKVISPGDSLNGRVLLQNQAWETNQIKLFHYENDFTIDFSALHYSAPEKVEFLYKLEGFNSEWIHTDSKRRYANYTGLPHGNYTFILKATNNDGLMCLPQDEVRLIISITPPFWKTNWFKFLFLLLIAGSAFLYYKNRTAQLQKQKRLLEIKVKERTEDLENANTELEERQEEILQQNEEIKLQKEVVESQNEKIEKAYHELSLSETHLEETVKERTKQLVIAKQKAEESDKLKSSFLANLSHEIRTPLNAIVGFSHLLIEEKSDAKTQERFKSMIQSSSDSLLNLINDILDFSKIEAGQIDIIKSPVPLSKIISEISELYKSELSNLIRTSNKNIDFRINISNELLEKVILTDENRLKQILQNLISNAIKFTSKGFVELGCELMPNGMFLKFYVKDTGIGISNEDQEIIFKRFRKIEKPSASLYRGTGIGLSICKHLVKLLGGNIGVESEIGVGSVFHVAIPFLEKNQVDENEVIPFVKLEFPDFTGKTILLAEDDDSNYILAEIYLKKTNATIIRARNGVEAVELCQQNTNFDIILMDIKMPLMDGFEALKNIRENKSTTIIIAQTAHSYSDEIEKIKNAGFTDYILKPINANRLLLMLQKYLV